MNIVYYVHDLHFPLREGVRKQAWWLAQAMKNEGHDVEIVCTSHKKEKKIIENIPITYGSALGIARVRADVMHYISHPTPLILPLLARARTKKNILTMFDGYLNGFWTRLWNRFVTEMVNKHVDAITLQTDFQIGLLRKTSVRRPVVKIPPIISELTRRGKRSKQPSLLFMSHLHPNKGIEEVLATYRLIRNTLPGATLTIADSGVTLHRDMVMKLRRMHDSSIILRKIVDPAEELSRAWVYLYPLRHPQETFSVPLSLIESMCVGTPWIASAVGGLSEWFDSRALVPAGDVHAIQEKTLAFIKRPYVGTLKKKIDNKRVLRQYLALYESSH